MSFVSIAVATVGTFATSEASYSVEVTLVYAPLVQEGTFQLWIGSTEGGVFWTMRLDMLHRAFASPGISVEEGTFAITAIDCGIAFTLPLQDGFAIVRFDAEVAQDFASTTTDAVLCNWDDGRYVIGSIDRGAAPCFD